MELALCVPAKSLQWSLTLCNPMEYSLPVFSVLGILQAGILEWLSCPPPGDLPNPGTEPMSPAVSAALQLDSFPLSRWGSPSYTMTP